MLHIYHGNILDLEVGAIVNAANKTLMGGGGVDGAIHAAAGPQLKDACRPLAPCPTGEVRVTEGFGLAPRLIFHTVGPIFHDGQQGEADDLEACYRNCLQEALCHGVKSIAFPAISTGAYGFPALEAAEIAVETCANHVKEHDTEIYLVAFDPDTTAALREAYSEFMAQNRLVIAVDGTLASGKGTLSKGLAADLGLPHLDTGLLYRATAKACLDAGVSPDDEAGAAELAATLDINAMKPDELRTAEVGQAASRVAVHPDVRKALFQLQRDFAAQAGGAILDGRDIGTVVCPDADIKFWIDADVEVRAARRVAELNAKGDPITQDEMVTQLKERDERDKNRAVAPMKPAEDAHLLDTTHLSIDAAREHARLIVDQVRARLAGR